MVAGYCGGHLQEVVPLCVWCNIDELPPPPMADYIELLRTVLELERDARERRLAAARAERDGAGAAEE
jgi:hypothetical protein